MKKSILLYLNTFLLSTVVLCFEIISTRISSVIFVNDYAFIIVSLALLGLGSGGVFSYYSITLQFWHSSSGGRSIPASALQDTQVSV